MFGETVKGNCFALFCISIGRSLKSFPKAGSLTNQQRFAEDQSPPVMDRQDGEDTATHTDPLVGCGKLPVGHASSHDTS